MSLRIRPATPADAPAIAAVHVNTWRAAYGHALPAEALAGLSVERREAQWQQWLTPAQPQKVFVAVERGEIVGFSSAGASRDADAGLWTAEVYALYVLPQAWGSGAGPALWSETCAALCRAGFRTLSLWVMENNPRARRFYEREGAAADGQQKTETLLGTPVVELRYRAQLSALGFAEGFAAALDAMDEDGMARFLDLDVTWAGGPGRGHDAVLSGIRARAAGPPDAFAAFQRESTVAPISGDRYRVQVADRLREAGHVHTWRHALAVTVRPERGILNVVPLDLPGEPARLVTFLRRIGIYG